MVQCMLTSMQSHVSMPPQSPVRPRFAVRRVASVPWAHGGYDQLCVRAAADIPWFDDSMIKGALVRGALACERIEDLERAFNRELWPLGYVARLETTQTDCPTVHVEIAAGR